MQDRTLSILDHYRSRFTPNLRTKRIMSKKDKMLDNMNEIGLLIKKSRSSLILIIKLISTIELNITIKA